MQVLNFKENMRQAEFERKRGLIVYFAYESRPNGLDASQILRLLEGMAQPCSANRLAKHLSDLVQLELVRVYRPGQSEESDAVRQAELLQAYARAVDDQESFPLQVRIRSRGVEFSEYGTVDGRKPSGLEQVK